MIFEERVDFELIKAIKKANNQLFKQENDIVRNYGLTASQYGVLECLYMKGDMCINELIKRLISTSGTMTVIVRNLEKMEYVSRVNDCNDKRVFKICLTEKGRDMVELILPMRKKQVEEFADVLTSEEKKELLNIFYKLKNKYKEK